MIPEKDAKIKKLSSEFDRVLLSSLLTGCLSYVTTLMYHANEISSKLRDKLPWTPFGRSLINTY